MEFLPYGRHSIDQEDIDAVVEVLKSPLLTTGPAVDAFEQAVAEFAGVKYGAAVNSGTAALHAAVHAIGVQPGDEVIVPSITFCATANAVVYAGGTPVFADVDPATLLIDPEEVKKKISPRTKAVIAVDYAGQMCDYDMLKEIAVKRNLFLVADACHSIGGCYKGRPSGSCADLSVFSFHPVKNITAGEGGMVVTDDEQIVRKVKRFRNHGITLDSHQREKMGSWCYAVEELGYNYRMPDILAALGRSQLKKMPEWIEKRNSIAAQYDDFFSHLPPVSPLIRKTEVLHAYHLYVIRLGLEELEQTKAQIFSRLKDRNIGVNVHYIPVYYHPFYQKKFNISKGLCPVAEDAYERILTIPLYPQMTPKDIQRVCDGVKEVLYRS